jgi:hypothetical protein
MFQRPWIEPRFALLKTPGVNNKARGLVGSKRRAGLMFVGYLGNKLKKEPNTSHFDKSGCRRFKVTQAGLKTRFELAPANLAMP